MKTLFQFLFSCKIFSILIIFLCITTKTTAQTYPFIHYTADDGLPVAQVWDIHQDKRGMIWIATNGGISRFDGYNFHSFTIKDGLKNDGIRNILEADNGDLWFGTSSGVVKYDGFSFTLYDQEQGIGSGIIWSSAKDKHGNLWFGSQDGGVTVFNGSDFIRYSTGNGLPDNYAYGLFVDSKNYVWIGTRSKGLIRMKSNEQGIVSEINHFSLTDGLTNLTVRSFAELPNGDILIGTRGGGLHYWNGKSLKKVKLSNSDQFLDVYSLFIRNERELFVGFFGVGIGVFTFESKADEIELKLKNIISINNGLPVNNINTIFTDQHDDLWVGHNKGISRLISEHIINFDKNSGVGDDLVIGILADSRHKIWIGSTNGLTQMTCDTITGNITDKKVFTTQNGLSHNEVRVIYEGDQGNIWVGTTSGLDYFDGKKFRNYNKNDGLAGNLTQDIFIDSKKRLWASSNEGISVLDISTKSPKVITTYTVANGFKSNVGYVTNEDKNGNIWVGTVSSGLAIIGDDIKYLSTENGLISNNVRTIHFDSLSQQVWIGTNGAGIQVFSYDSIHHQLTQSLLLNEKNGLISNYVTIMIFDRDHQLWIGTTKGVDVWKATYENGKVTGFQFIQRFTKRNGMIGNELSTSNAATEDKDGHLWFGFIEGASRVNKMAIQRLPSKLNPYLESVFLNDSIKYYAPFITLVPENSATRKRLLDTIEYQFPYEIQTYRFSVNGFSYRAHVGESFKFQLTGYDDHWTMPSPLNFKDYTNLSPGKYKFHFMVSGPDQQWESYSPALIFSIKGPIWYQNWFRFFIIGILLFIGYLIYEYRLQTIKRKNEELEKQIKERTIELKAYAQQLEKTNHELKQVNKIKSEFLSIAAHDLKNPLTSVTSTLNLLEDTAPLDDKNKERLHSISTATSRMLSIINQLLDVAALESGNISIDKKPIRLQELVHEVMQINQSYAQSKQIRLYFQESWEILPAISVDPLKMRIIVENILGNSIKFSNPGTIVTISVFAYNAEQIVSIKDDGPGISEEDQVKLFKKFQRLTARPTGNETSTGLGLAITKELVELHGGSISVVSQLGKGTEFIMRFPE